jgi:aminopeptidase N
MKLTVTVPKDWIAVGNGIERKYDIQQSKKIIGKTQMEDFLELYSYECNIYEFEETPRIAPYLYAICAGPYAIFEDFDP